MRERSKVDRIIITGSTPEEFAKLIARDFERATKVVKLANIPLE